MTNSSIPFTKHWRTTHGMTNTPEFSSWQAMNGRCKQPTRNCYMNYGGRGIEVKYENFEQFYADVGKRPSPKHSIDRIETSGHYAVGNCKWSTDSEQSRNRRSNVNLTLNGVTHCLSDWSILTGISTGGLQYRIDAGWSVEDVLTKPKQARYL